jgi:hypothetical protein
LGFSYHSVILLLGIAVAGLTLFGAIAVGPYSRRGLRMMLATISFAAFLGSAFWFTLYLGFIEQRRAIETRLAELRAQVLSTGSPLACLERTGDAVEAACAQTLFATPETLAAANVYTAARLDLLTAAARYPGPRTPQFDDAIDALRISLQQDPFGLTANILMLRRGCTAERCDDIAIFRDPARLRNNIRQKAFDANVARHAGGWRTPAPTAALPAASATPAIAPTGSETRAPIPDKYTLPSAASIPPVSIMNDEPPERPGPAPARDRAGSTRQPVTALPPEEQAPAALPSAPSSASDKQAPARREKTRPNAPLPIGPPQ